MKYYLYILLTNKNTYYCGIAKDPLKRFELHSLGKGAKYTRINKPLEIVFLEEMNSKEEALKKEYKIKKTLTRKEKINLIEENENKTKELLEKLTPLKV